jgi:hypothetical protein
MAATRRRLFRFAGRFTGSLVVWYFFGAYIPAAAKQQSTATPAICSPPPIVPLPTPAPDFSPKGIGGDQLWIAMGMGAISAPVAEHVAVAGEYGFGIRMIFLMPLGSTTVATLTGKSITSGAPMHVSVVGGDAVTSVILDASDPAIPIQHAGWAEFPSTAWFPENGCYEITATWEGGGWTIQYPFVAATIATPVG